MSKWDTFLWLHPTCKPKIKLRKLARSLTTENSDCLTLEFSKFSDDSVEHLGSHCCKKQAMWHCTYWTCTEFVNIWAFKEILDIQSVCNNYQYGIYITPWVISFLLHLTKTPPETPALMEPWHRCSPKQNMKTCVYIYIYKLYKYNKNIYLLIYTHVNTSSPPFVFNPLHVERIILFLLSPFGS